MALDNTKNGARGTLASGITAAATAITLTSGHGSRMPAVPFNAWIYNQTDYASDPHDDPNYEIVRVTARSTDTLTVTRAQEFTSAADHNTVGKTYRLVAGMTAKVVNTDLATVFTRSGTREYDARSYLAGDGVTDDTAALQTFFNQVQTDQQNATLYFDDATYVIGGALQDTSRRNAQLLLPVIATTGQQYTLKLIGRSVPACAPSGNVFPVALPRGTILKSTLTTGGGTSPSMFEGRGPVGGLYDEVGYLNVEFEKLIIQTVANPPISALNLRRVTTCTLEDLLIVAGTGMSSDGVSSPLAADSYGVILPDWSKGILQQIKGHFNVFGFYSGIRSGELLHAENIGLWFCRRGIDFGFTFHASQIDHLLVFWCPFGAQFTGAHYVTVGLWSTERAGSNGIGQWYADVAEIYDVSDQGRGDITWWTVTSDIGVVDSFTKTGGANLVTRRLGTP